MRNAFLLAFCLLGSMIGYARQVEWTAQEMDNLSGELVRRETRASVFISEHHSHATENMKGKSTVQLLKHDRNVHQKIATVVLKGDQLKRIMGLINKKAFRIQLEAYGVDKTGKKINGHFFNDNENITVAMTEKALVEVLDVATMGGLNRAINSRAAFVSEVMADNKSLNYLKGPTLVTITDVTANLSKALASLNEAPSLMGLYEKGLAHASEEAELKKWAASSEGTFRPTLSYELTNLDVGFSLNAANKTYDQYMKEKAFHMSRSTVPTFPYILAFYRMALTYDAGFLESRLGSNLKFLQVNSNEGPVKDKLEFSLAFRLPFERSVFKDNENLVVSPILKNRFETKLGPLTFLSKNTEADWKKAKKLPRRKLSETLLGAEFDAPKLGFSVELGGLMAANLNAPTAKQMLDFGPGLNFMSSWNLFGPLVLSSDINTAYLFGIPGYSYHGKKALGIEGALFLKVAQFKDISLNLVSDFLVASLQKDPKKVALSNIFGITVSYGRFFRLFG